MVKAHASSPRYVLVVGAGPVGLTLGCQLQAQSVDHLLIERTPGRSYFCRALGVTPRTLEIFEALGVVEEAIDAGVWLAGWTSFDNGVHGPPPQRDPVAEDPPCAAAS